MNLSWAEGFSLRNFVTREKVMDTNIDYQSVKDIARLLAASENLYSGDSYDATWNDHWTWLHSNRRAHDGANQVHSNFSRWHNAAVQIVSYLSEKGSFRSGVETSRIETLERENEQLKTNIELLNIENESLSDEAANLSEQLEKIRIDFAFNERVIERLEAELDDANIDIENLNAEVEQLETQLAGYDETEAELVEISDRATILDEIRETMYEIRNAGSGPGQFKAALTALPTAIEKLCDLLDDGE